MSETETIEKEEEEMKLDEQETEQHDDEEEPLNLETHPLIQDIKILDIQESFQYIKTRISENELFEKHIKKHLIRILCEKIRATNTVADADIAQTVVEGLDGLVSKKYVYQCLPTSFKDPKRVQRAQAAVETRHAQREDTAGFRSDEEINAEHIAMSENNSIHRVGVNNDDEDVPVLHMTGISHIGPVEEESQILDQSGGMSITLPILEYDNLVKKLEMAEKKIKAMSGDLPYDQCQELVKIVKWDKIKVNEVDTAWKAANSKIVFKIDLRNDTLLKAMTDKEYERSSRKSSKK